MKYQVIILIGLIVFSYQEVFLEEVAEDNQKFPDDYEETDFESYTIEDYLGLKENKCSDPYKSGPHWVGTGCNKLGQCNDHNCGPHSLHQVLTKFGIEDFTELQIATFAGTTKDGTSHEGLNKALKIINSKKGTKISIEWKSFSSFGSSVSARFAAIAKIICQPNKDVIIHDLYKSTWGHYETISGINVASSSVTVLNSLGTRSGAGYLGWVEERSFSTFAKYISGISQSSIAVLTKS